MGVDIMRTDKYGDIELYRKLNFEIKNIKEGWAVIRSMCLL